MRALPRPTLLRRCASLLVLLAAAGCADRPVTAPPAPPALAATSTISGAVTPMSVTVPTCAPTTTSSAGTCLPAAALARGHAYAMWRPDGEHDTCPQNVHDAYWTLGPDRKVYPTWHPPVVASTKPGAGCTFGHEHGRNPAGSALASWGLPFGYVNEYYSPNDPGSQRHEDHVGHKVDWANGWTFSGQRNGVPVTLTGDLLMKVHQGTHSRDALTNNLHEVFYYLRLSDGTEYRLRTLNGFGSPGGFKVECSNNDPRGDVGILWFYNRTRTRVWYTTPFRAGYPLTSDAVADRPDPATGRVIEQIVSPSPRYDLNGGVFPVRDFGTGHHVHAPN